MKKRGWLLWLALMLFGFAMLSGGCGGGGGGGGGTPGGPDEPNPESGLTRQELEEMAGNGSLQVHLDENQKINLLYGDKMSDVFPDKVESVADAIDALNGVKSVLGLKDPNSEFVGESVNTEEGVAYLLSQRHGDVPVYARGINIMTEDGAVKAVSSNYCGDIAEDFDTSPRIPQTSAESAARVGGALGGDDVVSSALVIYTLYDTPPVLAWCVRASGEAVNTVCFVDQQGKIINTISGELSVAATADDSRDRPLTFEVSQNGENFEMYDAARNIRTYTANEAPNIPGVPITSANNTDWDAEAVGAHYNIAAAYRYYDEKLGRKSFDGNGMAIRATVRYRVNAEEAYNNASFYPVRNGLSDAEWGRANKGMRFGDALPYSSCLDIVAHEFTHGVEQHKVGLIYQSVSGSLAEAYADILGNFAAMSFGGGDDVAWTIGENLGEGRTIRYINNPHTKSMPTSVGGTFYKDPYPPEGFNDSNDHGGMHFNSTIVSHAAYLMHTDGGGVFDSDTLGRLWYKSLNPAILHTDAGFINCRAAVEWAAYASGMSDVQIQCVRDAFAKVNIGGTGKTFLVTRNGSPSPGAVITLTLQDGLVGSPKTYATHLNGKVLVVLTTAGTYQVNVRSADGLASYSGTLNITPGQGDAYEVIEIKLTERPTGGTDVWDGTADTSWCYSTVG